VQCGVPVLGLENSAAIQEAAGGAFLPASATPESLAEGMKLIYRNENLREQLIRGAQQVQHQGTERLWQYLEEAAGQNQPTFAPPQPQ
jgi:hypothetical protein